MAPKTANLTIRLTAAQRTRLDRLAEKKLGSRRSTGTWLRRLALEAADREERAEALLRRFARLPPAREHADEVERRRREDRR
jgi:predicted transcriptional regulator